jgi:hypothetical protein
MVSPYSVKGLLACRVIVSSNNYVELGTRQRRHLGKRMLRVAFRLLAVTHRYPPLCPNWTGKHEVNLLAAVSEPGAAIAFGNVGCRTLDGRT